ncbi:hypothetical protein [Labrys neptuniae]
MDDREKETFSGNWTGRGLPAFDAANAVKRPIYWTGGVGGLIGAAASQGHWWLASGLFGLVLVVWALTRRRT